MRGRSSIWKGDSICQKELKGKKTKKRETQKRWQVLFGQEFETVELRGPRVLGSLGGEELGTRLLCIGRVRRNHGIGLSDGSDITWGAGGVILPALAGLTIRDWMGGGSLENDTDSSELYCYGCSGGWALRTGVFFIWV